MSTDKPKELDGIEIIYEGPPKSKKKRDKTRQTTPDKKPNSDDGRKGRIKGSIGGCVILFLLVVAFWFVCVKLFGSTVSAKFQDANQDFCVSESTELLTLAGTTAVEDIDHGDRVLSIDPETDEWVETRVNQIRKSTREVGTISVGKKMLRVTANHPLYDPNSGTYEPAEDWFEGRRDSLYVFTMANGGRVVPISAVQFPTGVATVYDLSVEHPLHNFVADTVLVHNKTRF